MDTAEEAKGIVARMRKRGEPEAARSSVALEHLQRGRRREGRCAGRLPRRSNGHDGGRAALRGPRLSTAAGQRCEDHGRRRGGGGRWRSRGPAGGGRRSSRVARALEQAALVVNGQWAQQVRYLILIHVILHFGPSAPGARGRTPANELFPGTGWRQLCFSFARTPFFLSPLQCA